MAMLEPRLCILDETDSGLDIDALRTVADGVNRLRSPEPRHHRHHPLPAPARLHRARPGSRAGGRARSSAAAARSWRCELEAERLCRRRSAHRVRRAARSEPEPWPCATAQHRAAFPPSATLSATRPRQSCPGQACRRSGASAASTAFARPASRPPRARTGSTPTSPGGRTGRWRWRPARAAGVDDDRALARRRAPGAPADLRQRPHRARSSSHVGGLPRGVRVMSLAARAAGRARPGRGSAGDRSRTTAAFTALNAAFAGAGAWIELADGADARRAAAAAVPHARPGRGVHEPPARSSSGSAAARGCG